MSLLPRFAGLAPAVQLSGPDPWTRHCGRQNLAHGTINLSIGQLNHDITRSNLRRMEQRASTALPFRTSVRRLSQPPPKEIRNEHIRRIVCLQSVVRVSCSGAGPGRHGPAMAPAHDLVARSVSAGAALHAWSRSKMASEACARCRVRKLGAAQVPVISESIAELIETSHGLHPIRCQFGSRLHGRRACNGVGEFRSADGDPRASRETARRIFCSRRTGGPLDREQLPGPALLNPSAASAARLSGKRFALREHLPCSRSAASFGAQPAQLSHRDKPKFTGRRHCTMAFLTQINRPTRSDGIVGPPARRVRASCQRRRDENAIGFGR